MKKRCTLALLLLVSASGYAQVLRPDTLGSVVILKITPLTLFDLDNTLQLGLEVPFRDPAWTFQQEMGYGHSAFNLWYNERENYPDRETWRFRSQLRYYFRKNNQSSPYIAGEYLFKKNSEERTESVGVDCPNGRFGPCAYFQVKERHLFRFVGAFHVKWGWQFKMGNRWYFDTYVGGGIRALQVRYQDGMDRTDFGWRFRSLFRDSAPGRYGPSPSFSAGVHFGYRL